MWKPAERIKYQALCDNWPSAAEAAQSTLFSPLAFANLSLTNRSWVPAMVPWRATAEGEVNDDVVDWYRRFAQGKPGAIVIEATGIRDIPSGPLLRIGSDRYIDGLKRVVEAVREASDGETKLYIQLIDFLPIRRRPERDKFLGRFLPITDSHRSQLGISDEAELRAALQALDDAALEQVLTAKEWENLQLGYRERVTDTELPAVAELPSQLPGLFADAAERARQAGFDGVELHYAHAYTMASFLSATNHRTDGYGGSLAGRLRLPLEVYSAVRERVGSDYTVGCRMLADEIIDGGSRLPDAVHFAKAFAAAGMDFISLSRGGKFDDAKQPRPGNAIYPYTGRSGYECMPGYISDPQGPFGRNVTPAATIRSALRTAGHQTPIVVAGGLYHFFQAEQLLDEGSGDIIGLARQALADPDWPLKVREGCGSEVRICRYHNYCEGLDQKHKQVTCELWDREALDEPDAALSHDGKRRLLAPAWQR